MGNFFFFFFLVSSFVSVLRVQVVKPVEGVPLSTKSRWIVDENGGRVKLVCVNWPAHLEPVVAEGLSKQGVGMIAKRITSMGFNCVRLTWPLFLATNQSLASLTVRQSFQRLGLNESISGFQANNPSMLDLPLIAAYQSVVSCLADNKVMVILDNHLSKPGWCCSVFDGSGFFGDQYFDPDLWLQGLTRMATLFRGVPNVIGMSLRNELRGPRQNIKDWYKYMQKGAEVVHSANPDLLVIVSGLTFGTDLSFILKQELELTFTGKLVFEMHWYGFSDGKAWESGNSNQVCGRVAESVMRRGGALLEKGWPLFISEFGVDQRGTNVNDNRYLNCFFAMAADLDFDWALWTLVGSYYTTQGVVGAEEFYGLLNWNWCELRNSSLLQRISILQSPFQGPDLSDAKPHKVIFHPATGLCIVRNSLLEPLTLGPCTESDSWSYTPQKILMMKGTYFCLQAEGTGKLGTLGIICTGPGSNWETISDSRMHLSTKLDDGTTLCLDIDSSNNIVTNACKCLSGDNRCDPASQWFKIVNATNILTRPLIQVGSNLGFGADDFGLVKPTFVV